MEATRQQEKPHGHGRDITTLAKQDVQEREFLAPEHGMETVALWIRSAALYLRRKMRSDELPGDTPLQNVFDTAAIAKDLLNDLEARAQMGAAKYGERLTAYNGRDPRLDCYQELLDGWVYIRQYEEEHPF